MRMHHIGREPTVDPPRDLGCWSRSLINIMFMVQISLTGGGGDLVWRKHDGQREGVVFNLVFLVRMLFRQTTVCMLVTHICKVTSNYAWMTSALRVWP